MANPENNPEVKHSLKSDGASIYSHIAGEDSPGLLESDRVGSEMVFIRDMAEALKRLKLPTPIQAQISEVLDRLEVVTPEQILKEIEPDVRKDVREDVRDELEDKIQEGMELEVFLDTFCRRILNFRLDDLSPLERREVDEIVKAHLEVMQQRLR